MSGRLRMAVIGPGVGLVRRLGDWVSPGSVALVGRAPISWPAAMIWLITRLPGLVEMASVGPQGEPATLVDEMSAASPEGTPALLAVRTG